MFLRATISAILWISLASLGQAQERGWIVTVGGGGAIAPSYQGADSFSAYPIPKISIRRSGADPTVSLFSDSIGASVFEVGGLKVGPVIALVAPRKEKDFSELKGLGDIDYAFEAGGFAEYWARDWLRIRLEIRRGFVGHDGFDGSLGVMGIWRPFAGLTLAGGPRMTFSDRRYAMRYFGIDDDQGLGSGLDTYRPNAGVKSLSLEGVAIYAISKEWTITGHLEIGRLAGFAASSPLVRERGDEVYGVLGVVLTYSFEMQIPKFF